LFHDRSHDDQPNQQQDSLLMQIYAYIHEIGDEEAVKHIESMGIMPATKEHPYLGVKGKGENQDQLSE